MHRSGVDGQGVVRRGFVVPGWSWKMRDNTSDPVKIITNEGLPPGTNDDDCSRGLSDEPRYTCPVCGGPAGLASQECNKCLLARIGVPRWTPPPERDTCPECEGHCWVSGQWWTYDGERVTGEHPCPECNGRGIVAVEREPDSETMAEHEREMREDR